MLPDVGGARPSGSGGLLTNPAGFIQTLTQLVNDAVQQVGYDPQAVPRAEERLAAATQRATTTADPVASRVEAMRQLYDNNPLTDPRPAGGTDTYGALRLAQLMNQQAAGTAPPSVEQARAEVDQAYRRERDEALGLAQTGGKPRNIRRATARLTQEQYDSLNPMQQAAVQFNQLLAQAVRKDRKLADTYQPTAAERKAYDEAVAEMFGPDRGSDMYAPETLALLRQLKFQDSFADLDDFLTYRAAIRDGDLKRLVEPEPTQTSVGEVKPGLLETMNAKEFPDNPARQHRLNLARLLAGRTQDVLPDLMRSNPLLGSETATLRAARNPLLEQFGGIANKVKGQVGYGQGRYDNGRPVDMNAYFQTAFEAMADSSSDPAEIVKMIRDDLSPEDARQLFNYLDERTRLSAQYNIPLGGREGATYRTPAEILELLTQHRGGGNG